MELRSRLRSLLLQRSVRTGDFLLASGARSSFYIDARQTTMTAQGQLLIGTLALEAVREAFPTCTHVGGLTLGADPISYAIAHASASTGHPIDAFTVRKAPKEHGLGRRIEGGLPTGARVVVIEDSMTTGGSALEAIRALQGEGVLVLGVLALVDREEGAVAHLEAAGVPRVIPLFTASELLGTESAPDGSSPAADGASQV